MFRRRVGAAVLIASAAWRAGATELDNSHADLGYIDTHAALSSEPGFYFRDDLNVTNSGRLNDQDGRQVNLNLGTLGRFGAKFRSTAVADVLAMAYVPDYRLPILDAAIGVAAYQFLVDSRAGVTTAIGQPQERGTTKGGLGDLTIVPLFVAFQVPYTNLHILLSPFEFTAPTGRYDRNDPIGNNTGLNYWSYRPALTMTYVNQTGQELNINIGTSFNTQNQATHYKSGDEVYFTYAAQQYLTPQFAVGVTGYYYKQFTDDRQDGVVVNTNPNVFPFDPLNGGPGNRGEAFAIGPVLTFEANERLSLQAHWDHDLFTYNRPQHDQVWLRGVFRF